MGQLEPFLDFEHEFQEDMFSNKLVEKNHQAVEMLAKKGYKLRIPHWNYPMAS